MSYDLVPMGGIEGLGLEGLFDAYGANAAQILMAGAKTQPAGPRRAAFLKTAMGKIDPAIWGKAKTFAADAVKHGVPASAAVELGIAHVMSRGIVKELVDTGTGKRKIKRRTQLGMFALGIDDVPACTGTMTWRAATSSSPAHWERTRAGEAPMPGPDGVCYGGTTRVHAPSAKPGSGTTAPAVQMMSIGPWQVPVDATRAVFGVTIRDHRGGDTTPTFGVSSEWQAKIGREIVRSFQLQLMNGTYGFMGCLDRPEWIAASDLGIQVPPLLVALNEEGAPTQAEIDSNNRVKKYRALALCNGSFNLPGNRAIWPSGLLSGGWVPAKFFGYTIYDSYPLYRVKHPVTGEDFGLFLQASPITGGNAALSRSQGGAVLRLDQTTNETRLRAGGPLLFVYRKIQVAEKSRWIKFWDFIASISATIIAAVEAVVGAVADLACTIVNAAAAPAAQVAGTAPTPQTVAIAAGANIASGLCSPTPATPPGGGGGGGDGESSNLPLYLAGGAALLLVVLAARKKKR